MAQYLESVAKGETSPSTFTKCPWCKTDLTPIRVALGIQPAAPSKPRPQIIIQVPQRKRRERTWGEYFEDELDSWL